MDKYLKHNVGQKKMKQIFLCHLYKLKIQAYMKQKYIHLIKKELRWCMKTKIIVIIITEHCTVIISDYYGYGFNTMYQKSIKAKIN